MADLNLFKRLYDSIADRKGESQATGPYTGGNGRIDRATGLVRSWSFLKSGTLVDVGGATGNLGYALRDSFSRRIVVDIVAACRAPAESKGNEFYQADVDAEGLIVLADHSVDLVVALDFIEHILDPESFASECHRVLKPGGKVLINTPNIQHWRHLQSLVVDGLFPHTSGDREVYHGGHVAFFNRWDLETIFKAFEKRSVHVEGLPADPPPPIWQTLAAYPDKVTQLSYADLIFSCEKP